MKGRPGGEFNTTMAEFKRYFSEFKYERFYKNHSQAQQEKTEAEIKDSLKELEAKKKQNYETEAQELYERIKKRFEEKGKYLFITLEEFKQVFFKPQFYFNHYYDKAFTVKQSYYIEFLDSVDEENKGKIPSSLWGKISFMLSKPESTWAALFEQFNFKATTAEVKIMRKSQWLPEYLLTRGDEGHALLVFLMKQQAGIQPRGTTSHWFEMYLQILTNPKNKLFANNREQALDYLALCKLHQGIYEFSQSTNLDIKRESAGLVAEANKKFAECVDELFIHHGTTSLGQKARQEVIADYFVLVRNFMINMKSNWRDESRQFSLLYQVISHLRGMNVDFQRLPIVPLSYDEAQALLHHPNEVIIYNRIRDGKIETVSAVVPDFRDPENVKPLTLNSEHFCEMAKFGFNMVNFSNRGKIIDGLNRDKYLWLYQNDLATLKQILESGNFGITNRIRPHLGRSGKPLTDKHTTCISLILESKNNTDDPQVLFRVLELIDGMQESEERHQVLVDNAALMKKRGLNAIQIATLVDTKQGYLDALARANVTSDAKAVTDKFDADDYLWEEFEAKPNDINGYKEPKKVMPIAYLSDHLNKHKNYNAAFKHLLNSDFAAKLEQHIARWPEMQRARYVFALQKLTTQLSDNYINRWTKNISHEFLKPALYELGEDPSMVTNGEIDSNIRTLSQYLPDYFLTAIKAARDIGVKCYKEHQGAYFQTGFSPKFHALVEDCLKTFDNNPEIDKQEFEKNVKECLKQFYEDLRDSYPAKEELDNSAEVKALKALYQEESAPHEEESAPHEEDSAPHEEDSAQLTAQPRVDAAQQAEQKALDALEETDDKIDKLQQQLAALILIKRRQTEDHRNARKKLKDATSDLQAVTNEKSYKSQK